MSDKKQDSANMNEKELSDLLDSVSEQFSKLQRPGANTKDEKESPKEKEGHQKDVPKEFPPLFDGDEEFKENWSNLMKAVGEPFEGDDGNSFHENLHKALKSISEKAQDISGKDNVINEDELAKMFLNLSEDNAPGARDDAKDGGGVNILPLMNSIVENLLSKDFLYPTLVDLSSKYPTYLKENKGKIPEKDYERYEKQLTILNEICAEFDKENKDTTEAEKKARFPKVMELMQQMQSYGTPPADLVPEKTQNSDSVFSQFNQLDQQSNCSLM